MFEITKDLEFSHSILNSLHSAEQGEFAYFNILTQMGNDSESLAETIEMIKKRINQQNDWFEQVWQNTPIFELKWKQPNRDDAKEVLAQLTEKRSNLIELSQELAELLSEQHFDALPATSIETIIACLGRHRYAHDNYIRSMLELARAVNSKEQEELYTNMLENSDDDITILHDIIDRYQEGQELDVAFFNGLFAEVVTLGGAFRSQIHDMSQLLAIYEGTFTYEHAGIPENEAADWHSVNVSAYEAGYWRAYYIGPDEIFHWLGAGFTNFAIAGEWRAWGFPHDIAAKWHERGFSPEEASTWLNAEIPLSKAMEFRDLGFSDPAEVALEG